MVTKSKKPANKKPLKTGLKTTRNISWKVALPIIALTIVAGGYFVYSTFASTTAGTYSTGNASFSSSFTTSSVRSTDSWLCVATKFNSGFVGFAQSAFKWRVQVYKGYQWTTVATSQTYTANDNRDHACYNSVIYTGNTYRVVFAKDRSYDSHDISGGYFVSGYYRP